MGKTISFVATEKLAEWLEEESERRMTTVSSTAQQLLAEKYREEQQGEDTATRDAPDPENEDVGEEEPEPDALDRNPDKWYRPDSNQHNYAVSLPDSDRKYYKTREGAAKRIRREYE